MAIKLFEQLNIEWARLVKARTSAAALADWQQEDTALHGLHDLANVLDVALGDDRCRADAVLRALLRTERHRSTAQRIVLQTVMPGLVGATNRYRNGPASADEVAATVVAAAWQRIAEYPLDRRPRSIAANIVLDSRQRASKALFRHTAVEIPCDTVVSDHEATYGAPDSAVSLLQVLGRAVHTGVVSAEDAALVALTRICDVPVADLAEKRAVLPHSLRRHRLRVEARLARA